MNEITKQMTISEMYQAKLDALDALKRFEKLEEETKALYEQLDGYAPFRVDYRFDNYEDARQVKHIDRICWRRLVQMADLKRYMLCTEYDKMTDQIEKFEFPEFTIENAEGYIASLKSIIYDNVKTLMREVYKKLTDEHYYTGSGYSSRKKKKRNNNGIDKSFILTTHDYSRVFGWYQSRATLTDDLEKLCYLFDSEKLPEHTIIEQMRSERTSEMSNKYFTIKLCKNGNTHYTLTDEIRNKLNAYGGNTSLIHEAVKIKIFD